MTHRWVQCGAMLLCLVGLWSRSTAAGAAGWTVEELAQRHATPAALAQFFHQELTFARDAELFEQVDYWQSPEEFLDRGAGDCEDYALLAQAIFQRQRREAVVLSLYGPEGYAHTVCLFAEEGRYHAINQDALLTLHAPSLEAAATALLPGWTWGGIAQRAGTRGRRVHIIRNPSP